MVKILSKELLAQERKHWNFKTGTELGKFFQEKPSGKRSVIHEFVGTDAFAKAFYERQRYEVDAGRDSEPTLYTPLYTIIEDPALPRNVPVARLGPAAVVFDEVLEGGEVKFMTVGQSAFSVPIRRYGVGLEINEDLVDFNEIWDIAIAERQVGISFNALLNHIHLSPILNFAYAAANQTNGPGLTFDANASLPEKYLRTFEEAMIASTNDTDNPRRGPYAVLCSIANLFTIERALTVVAQQGITKQSSAVGLIQAVIGYNGWTGARGKLVTTYPGVTTGKAYLVDLGLRDRNFRSYVKRGLTNRMGNADVSRFILEQIVWHSLFGMHADVIAGVEEITLPTAS